MKQRLPVALSAAALAVAVLGATPLGHAAGNAAVKGVPFAKKAAFATKAGFAKRAALADKAKVATRATNATNATNAENATHADSADNATAVNGIQASTTPTAGALFPLGPDAKFPASVIPSTDGTGGAFWSLSGNAATSPGTNFLGTTDSNSLVFKTNNSEAMRIDSSGNLGVGTVTPGAKVEASSSSIAIMGTSTSRAIIGRLGVISCPAAESPFLYAVGGCAGAGGGTGVQGSSDIGIGVDGHSGSGRAVEGFAVDGIGVIGDSTTRGVIGTLGRTSCAGVYAVGGCGGTADGVLARVSTGTAVRAIVTDVAGSIFIGEAGAARVVRIDNTGKGFFNGGTQMGGADYAESMQAPTHTGLEPGDVLAIDPRHGNAVRRSNAPSSQLVAGVYSTKPAVLAVGRHRVDDSLAGEVPVAMLGVVPTKVSAENGAVRAGDLLTTARTAGYAMKARPLVVHGVKIYPTGAILGKALQPLAHGKRMIKVLVNLR